MGETEGLSGQYSRQSFPLEIVYLNRSTDIAILRPTKAAVLTPLPVDWTAKPKELDSVWIRGFPLGGPLEGADGNVGRSRYAEYSPPATPRFILHSHALNSEA